MVTPLKQGQAVNPQKSDENPEKYTGDTVYIE